MEFKELFGGLGQTYVSPKPEHLWFLGTKDWQRIMKSMLLDQGVMVLSWNSHDIFCLLCSLHIMCMSCLLS